MYEYLKIWLELKTDKRAVTALEYGLIAAVIIAVCATAFVSLGTQLSTTLTGIHDTLQNTTPAVIP
jgi:Flp pilus assembly pilin Flp